MVNMFMVAADDYIPNIFLHLVDTKSMHDTAVSAYVHTQVTHPPRWTQ